MPPLLYEKRDGLAYITFNRPERRNAMDPETIVRLSEALLDFEADDEARVAIITGAGDKAFCSGADLGRLIPLYTRARQPEDEWDRRVLEDRELGRVSMMRGHPIYKPIISAINGFCLAGGTELVQATDIRIAAEHATFGLMEVKRAIVPAAGSMARLARQVPWSKAMEILLVGDPISAQEAHRIGLVNYVVPLPELMPTAEKFARKIAENGPLAVRKIKEAVIRSSGLPLTEAYKIENEVAREVMRSDDAKEGPRAFMEKRPARYTGHWVDEPLLHYEVHGVGGPYLLLVHGMLSSRAQWLANIPALSSFCRTVVVELFGHGRSPSPEDPPPYSPPGYVEEFERLRQALGVDRWLLCGQSLGAALTLRYALDHPEHVVAQVFTNSMSALASPGWSDYVRPIMEAQAKRLEREGRQAIENHPLNPSRGSRLPSAVRDALVEDCRLHDLRGVAFTGLYTVPDSSVRDRIASNSVPSLLIVGEREERFREYRLFAEEHMPHLTVAGFDAGHAVNAEVADGFNRAVEDFLRPIVDSTPTIRAATGRWDG